MKIAIFGGSFDPIHNGHLGLAEKTLKSGLAESVVFMPALNQPFKLDLHPADGSDRLRMIELAIEGIPGLSVSDYELSRPHNVSYTVETLRAMRAFYGDKSEISFIVGADSFLKIHTWMGAEEILTEYAIIVGIRPGYPKDEIESHEEFIRSRYGTELHFLLNTPVDVSSTEIRRAAEKGCLDRADVALAIPPSVKEYIIQHGIYGK